MKKYYEQIDETVYTEVLSNGLQVFVIPKRDFQKTYVTMTSKYGSVHQRFKDAATGEWVTMPEGIAHFLEHKMFEKEQGDMFNQFSSLGASANAFTTYDRTSYLFTTVNKVKENILLLLEMVQRPYFSKASIDKEIGIISEEIRMYQDQPNYRLYHQTLTGMYHNHPVRQDIAGTIPSISEITAEKLYQCYETFYRPENMVMFLVGNVDENIISYIDEHQMNESDALLPPVIAPIEEPSAVRQTVVTSNAEISKPKLMIGIKSEIHKSQKALIQSELEVMFIMDLLFGEQTDFYQNLLKENLIDESFGYTFSLEPTFSHLIIAGSTQDPEALSQRVIAHLDDLDFDEVEFNRLVRQTIGEFISSLNSPEYIANQFTRYYFNGAILFDILPVIERMTLEEALSTFKATIENRQWTISRMVPNE